MGTLLKLPKNPLHAVLVLLLAAALVLGLGINKPTGLTGKDVFVYGPAGEVSRLPEGPLTLLTYPRSH